MRFYCLVALFFLWRGFCFAQTNIQSSDAFSGEPVVLERRLSSGAPFTIIIRSSSEPSRELSITIFVDGTEICIPTECLADLRECSVPDGVQVADFAGDIFLLLAGGEGDSSWQAKLTLRNQRVVERELQKGTNTPEITVYNRTLDVHEGRISSKELQNESRSKGTPRGSVRP